MNRKKIFDKFSFYLLFIAIVVLPFSYRLSSIVMGIMVFVTLINPFFYKEFKIPSIKETYGQVFYLSILFFVFHIISVFLSDNVNEAWLKVQIKLPFLIFPILFLYRNPIIKQRIKNTLLAFVLGSFVNIVVLLGGAIYRSVYFWNGKIAFYPWIDPIMYRKSFLELFGIAYTEFTYSHLSVFFHPAYVAMYVTLSIAILFYFLKSNEFKNKGVLFGFKVLIIIFSLTIILLNSRAGILAFTFIVSLSLFLEIFRYKKYFSGIIYSILFSLVIYFSIYHTRLYKNFAVSKTVINQVKTVSKKKILQKSVKKRIKPKNSRIVIWQAAIETAKENFLWGVGIGDVKTEMYKHGQINKLKKHVYYTYDAHNQFLQVLVGLGIGGLILLFLLFYFPLALAIRQQRYLLFSQLAIVGINSMFESVLERSYGILFFSIFFFLFLAYAPSYKDSLRRKKLDTE